MSVITGFDILRLVLFGGLVAHKLVWEMLKRNRIQSPAQRPPVSILKRMVKTAKVAVLFFLVLQTLFLDILPIAADPTGPRIAGLGLFLAGLTIAILGRVQLGNNWKDAEELASAQTPSLTTNGIYRFIRHPIYGGDMLLLLGLELALNSWLVLVMVVPILVFARVAIAEEGSLADKFADYAAYRQHTKRFIPFVI